MSESAKTISLVVVAVLLAAVAFAARPHITTDDSEGQVGQSLFPDWQDPAAAKSLQITSVDETTNSLNEFRVADVNGRWVVPSHDDYPANAEDHVFKAATGIIGVKILAVVSDAPGDQETYGVVEPNEKTLTSASFSGFGRMVVVKDAANKDLARLIIGKEDKSPGTSGPSNLRFVRRAGQDRIYRVSLDTDILTTKFQDWVNTDVLAMKQPWDVDSLLLRDYALERAIVRKADIDLSFDETKAAWSLKKLTEYTDDKPKVVPLPAGDELDSSKINEFKTNVSGLKLVNVARKPAVFAEKLKTGKSWIGDPDAQNSLLDGGFMAVPRQNPTDVFGAGGDMKVGMKDGVEYTIRFGGAAMTLKGDTGEKKAAAAKNEKHTTVERVVFVTAAFNPDLIPKPVLEPLPEAKKPAAKSEPKKPESPSPAKKPEEKSATPAPAKAPAENKPTETKPADNKPAASKPDAGKSSRLDSHLNGELLALADTADESKKPADAKTAEKPAATSPAAKKPDAEKSDAEKTADTKSTDKNSADKKQDTAKPADKNAKPAAGKPAAEPPKSDIQRAEEEEKADAERKRIETDNRRKQDEYDATVKKGKAHAKELNSRFADWYYMISEDDYKKIHVGLSDLTKTKPASQANPLGPGIKSPFDLHGLKPAHP